MFQWLKARRPGPIGVDLGVRSVKLMQFNGDRSRLLAAARWELPYAERLTPPQRDARLSEAIGRARESQNFRGKEALLCLNAQELFVQNVRVPAVRGEALDKIVRQEAASRLSCEISEAEVRYLEAGEVRQGETIKQEVILMATTKSSIDRSMAIMEAANLRPLAMDAEPLAVARCYARQYRREDDRVVGTLYVHVGVSNTAVVITRGADVMFVQPPANVKDFSPFKSQHRDGLADEALAKWHELSNDAIHAARTGSYESALDLFDRAAVLDDRYAGLHYERGRVLFELGRFDEAKVAFERALAEDVCPLRMLPAMQQVLTDVAREHRVPVVDFAGELQRKCREESGHSLLGNAYFLDHVHPTIETNRLLGRMLLNHLIEDDVVRPATAWNEKAASSVTRAVMESVNERDHALAKSMLGRVLRWAGKDEEAERLIASAVESLPDDAPTLSSYAASLKRRGKADEAIAYYRRALQIEPGLVEASVNLGALLVKKGQFDEAITIYTAILEQRPDDGRTMGRLAVALSESGRIEEGESAFLQALRLDADDPTIHINYGQALIHQGRLDEAVARFQAALHSHPGAVRAWVLSGVALSRMGRIAEAVSHYEEALRLDPKSAQAHYNLGVAFLSSGDEDRAVPHFRSAIEADSMLVDAYFNLGQALASLGKFDEAKQHLERALLLAPNDPMAYLQLGMVLMVDGQYIESVANLRKGILIAPENVNLRERLAWVLATSPNDGVRDGREAVELGERLVARLEKSSARAFDSLAAAYAEVGQFDDACRTVELAIKVAEEGRRSGYAVQLRERLSQYRRREPFRLRVRD
ncbi:MAG: tetratricopeptide repeat protein [Planctomycetes bacterium]|nr:tetratricopeptide repeat protein [Planctomycetota bacterium]